MATVCSSCNREQKAHAEPQSLGKWSFWTMFTGFNVAFFLMHILGLEGMPRRIYTYADRLAARKFASIDA